MAAMFQSKLPVLAECRRTRTFAKSTRDDAPYGHIIAFNYWPKCRVRRLLHAFSAENLPEVFFSLTSTQTTLLAYQPSSAA